MVRLRPAATADWARLFCFRNDPLTRAMFKSEGLVPLKEHMAWLKETLANAHAMLLLADDDERGGSIGTVRPDVVAHKKAEWAEMGITVEPRVRGQGYAEQTISAVIERGGTWRGNTGLVAGLLASVKTDNYPSLRAFAACGFVPVKMTDAFATLERSL